MPPNPLEYYLRGATDVDYPFIEQLYVETSKPLLIATGAWDRQAHVELFKSTYYDINEVKIIVVAGADAGWLQVHEDRDEIVLYQIHIKSECRSKKIGTRIIASLINKAQKQQKRMSLSVYRNNRAALDLYLRLGFKIIAEEEMKFHLSSSPRDDDQT